mmetsp:Transcript_43064/g.131142  ORF Transcript_43064/g.131142 Transcript_43064/m.131142 type:complete len:516 (-) Transcript_43064:151-1698(-)|eukprot:CAMPEP_0113552982 /NCGR_PEP_ID=MMETSP0015_2-20120614/15361_1 /TAXON_ID=2838 /ORGANISM="Odontella" /LENGTH=515 /DNA_ID=CAMNT_0000454003 /DNA_START=60 /DNA_END=1607 /DNA_ORIENTATION=+ /assembly_acc=CAM_ASM_000160
MEAAGTDPTVASALVIAGCVALFYYLWSSKKNDGGIGTGTGGKKRRVDRIAEARRHSRDVDAAAAASECESTGRPWKDPTFGHDPYPEGHSIGRTLELRDGERGKPLVLGKDGVTWQPPSKFASTSRPLGVRGDDGLPTWLYSDNDGDGVASAAESMETDDIRQGSVGDCYFLAALSAVVQHHPDLADDLIDETYEEYGIYGVSFWNGGKWRMTWVDSYFPCYRPSANKSRGGKHRLIFAGATDRKEIWPLVVEKAYAKMAGSYEAISGGHIAEALGTLTGGKARRRDPGRMGARGTDDWNRFREEVLSDECWVGAGSQRQRTGADDAAEQKRELRGIVTGHAYAVVAVYEDEEGDDGSGSGLRLVELRNPWGHGEWTGDWGPGSRQWNTEEGRRAVASVGPSRSNDGRFWMKWEDFVNCFDSVDTCYMNFSDENRARRAELKEEAARIVAEKDRPKRKQTLSSAGAGGGDKDGGRPGYTQEDVNAADAMMAQLLAEEAKEKRKKKKTGTKKKSR